MVFLHVGLPKTGTTFLQHKLLGKAPEVDFVHRKYDRLSEEICRCLRDYCQVPNTATAYNEQKLVFEKLADRIFRSKRSGRPIIISDENISIHPQNFWQGKQPTPEEVAVRIKSFFNKIPGMNEAIKIIIFARDPVAVEEPPERANPNPYAPVRQPRPNPGKGDAKPVVHISR